LIEEKPRNRAYAVLKKVEAKRQDNEDTWQEQFAGDGQTCSWRVFLKNPNDRGPENPPSRLRLPFHRSESSHRADPSPVSFTLVHVVPRQGHAVQVPRELRLKNHQTAVAECQFARGEVKFPHAAKPLIGKPTFLSVTLYEALTPMTKRFRIVQAQDFHVGDNQARTLDDGRNL